MASNTPGTAIPADYGKSDGSSLEEGMRLHQVLAQGDGSTVPGAGDTFDTTPLSGVGKRAAKRETVSSDSMRSTPPPSGPMRGTAAADHGESDDDGAGY